MMVATPVYYKTHIEWSTERDQLCAALVAFGAAARNPPKDRRATIRTKTGPDYTYEYADLASILDAVRSPLVEAGLWVVQAATGDHGPAIDITTEIIHTSGQWARSTLTMRRGLTAQEDGSAISYGRRYGLMAMLGLMAETDDDGRLAPPERRTKRGEPTTAHPTQVDPETGEVEPMPLRAPFRKVFERATVDLPPEAVVDIIRSATNDRTTLIDELRQDDWPLLKSILDGKT